ncbi:MAG: response regulator [Spirochaetales bacterium]|nr:response regulator [Spirochaetales bacterium]
MSKELVIVDDNPINLKLLESILENNFELRLFADPSLAIDSIKQKKPDMILLDIKMPKMDGFEACREIKKESEFADIPVIFLSASNDSESKQLAQNAGGVDYIEKPFKIDEIMRKVNQYLTE